MKNIAIIVAGGRGSRMNSATPKQFMELKDKPVIFHAIQSFIDTGIVDEIVVALPENHIQTFNKLLQKHNFSFDNLKVCKGGETRFHSVNNALNSLENKPAIVAVHDAVRPFVSQKMIIAGFDLADKYKTAVPCIPLKDSIRFINENQNNSIKRENYKIIQTPQFFQLNLQNRLHLPNLFLWLCLTNLLLQE
jgi:2-C-methyl-D-erythritol 4-phosphate cytidylyltransferase